MTALLQDLRYGVRTMARDRAFTVVAILTLAFALGANTAIFTVVNAILLRPLPFDKPEQILRVSTQNTINGSIDPVLSHPNIEDLRTQSRSLDSVGVWVRTSSFFWEGDEPVHATGSLLSTDMFRVLRAKPLLGRTFTPADDRAGAPPLILLSYDTWQRIFHRDPTVVGRVIRFGTGNKRRTIVGVMPQGFVFPIEADCHDFWTPFHAEMDAVDLSHRDALFIEALARLKDGATIDQARAEAEVLGRRIEALYPAEATGFRYHIVPFHEQLVEGVRPALLLLLGAVALVLLIGCANVANLLLARAAGRRREIAIRSAVGATRGRIVVQLLVESVLLAVIAGACGVLLASWGLEVLKAFAPAEIPRLDTISLDLGVLAFTLALSVLTGVVFGLAPALAASKTNLNETLKEGTRGSTEGKVRNRIRNILVTAAIALSLVLLVGAGLLLRSFMRVTGVNPGFDFQSTALVEVSARQAVYDTPAKEDAYTMRVVDAMRRLPGVRSAGAVDMLPLDRNERTWAFQIIGQPPPPLGQEPSATTSVVTPDYFRTMSIPLLRGRDVSNRDLTNTPFVIMVNETFARRWFANQNPIGRKLLLRSDEGDQEHEIIGVVGDVHYHDLTRDPAPMLYLAVRQHPQRHMHYIVQTANAATIGPTLRGVVRQIDHEQPVLDVRTMADVRGQSLATRRFNMILLGVLSALALILAAVGIYSLMSYTVTQRTSEIGIRMALGAGTADVFRLIVGNALKLVGIGVVVGVGAALAATRLMSTLLFGVGASDPATFAAICITIAAVALVASWVPARRAARVDPLVAIRYD
ncbi:MAG TPA: ABC transporter permease [Thermoanaerobaculia bacterium]|jgi:putative ABC transport system permease protein|nr:ABC transporter permease [Thermoanaerobaculia bacterium]